MFQLFARGRIYLEETMEVLWNEYLCWEDAFRVYLCVAVLGQTM